MEIKEPKNATYVSELPVDYDGDVAIKVYIDEKIATVLFFPKKENKLKFSTHDDTFSDVHLALLTVLLGDLDEKHEIEFVKTPYMEIEPKDYMS